MQTREKEVIAVLADKTHPQIRAIDGAYQRKFGRTLLEMLDGEKALKGNSERNAVLFEIDPLLTNQMSQSVWHSKDS